jgi:hypothetical protein
MGKKKFKVQCVLKRFKPSIILWKIIQNSVDDRTTISSIIISNIFMTTQKAKCINRKKNNLPSKLES